MSVVSAPTKMRTPKEINGVILRRVMPLLSAPTSWRSWTALTSAWRGRLEFTSASPPPPTDRRRAVLLTYALSGPVQPDHAQGGRALLIM